MPGLRWIYRRRGTASIADPLLDRGEGGRGWQLPAHPNAQPRRSRLAQTAEDPLAGSTPSHRCSCSHAQETTRTPKTPLRKQVTGRNYSATEVNIRYRISEAFQPPKPHSSAAATASTMSSLQGAATT